jgi:DNA-binding transcriptional LysR family regulator
MDDLRSVRHFIEVATAGSFTAAADRLSLTTSALSKSIAGLEQKLALRLFVRTTRAVHLTADGQALFERLAPSLEHIAATLNDVGASSLAPSGLVRLSTVTAYGKHSVLPVLPEFFARYPGIELAISFHDGGRGMSRQAFDVRINWGEEQETDKVAQVLCRMPLVLVASPDYLARRGVPKTPQDLAQHECIMITLPNRAHGRWTFVKRASGDRPSRAKPVKINPKGRLLVVDELDAVVTAARLGLGLVISWSEIVQDALDDGALVRLLADYDISGHDQVNSEIIMQYPASKYLQPRVRVVVDFLSEKLRDTKGPGPRSGKAG